MPGIRPFALARCRRLIVVALIASACDDSSAPPLPIAVTIEPTIVEGPTISALENGTNEVACRVSFAAVATGAGTAVWDSGAFLFYGGRDRSEPLDTVPLSAAKLADYWDAGEIIVGEMQQFQVEFTAPWGFGIGVIMYYHALDGGARGTAATEFDCGPRIPPDSPPPTVTALSVEPAGTVEPGKQIVVSYAANSEAGLSRTVVRLSGACTLSVTNAEQLVTAVTRSVTLHVPSDCRLDQPLTVTVTMTDAASAQASRSVTVPLADLTPPTLAPFFVRPTGLGTDRDLAGEYFIGDSLNVNFGAIDNVQVTALIWAVQGTSIRDSMLVRGGVGYYRIPIVADWPTGPVQLRLSARDSVGHESAPYNSPANALQIFPSVARPSKTIALVGEVSQLLARELAAAFLVARLGLQVDPPLLEDGRDEVIVVRQLLLQRLPDTRDVLVQLVPESLVERTFGDIPRRQVLQGDLDFLPIDQSDCLHWVCHGSSSHACPARAVVVHYAESSAAGPSRERGETQYARSGPREGEPGMTPSKL